MGGGGEVLSSSTEKGSQTDLHHELAQKIIQQGFQSWAHSFCVRDLHISGYDGVRVFCHQLLGEKK